MMKVKRSMERKGMGVRLRWDWSRQEGGEGKGFPVNHVSALRGGKVPKRLF